MAALSNAAPGYRLPDPLSPFAALFEAPIPATRPLGQARVIHAWEAPQDLWRPAEPATSPAPAAPPPSR
jgi:hypothetical protein